MGDGSIGDYQGGGGDASFGGGPADIGGGGVTGYSSGDYGQNVFGALDRALAGEDLDRGSLETLSALGLGKVDISPTQNVEQALASRNVHNVLNYAAPALASLVPGYGTVSALGRGIAGIHGLMTGQLSAKDVVPGLVAGALGARTGIPAPVFEGIITGNLGKAAGAGAQAGLAGLLGSAFNINPGLVGAGLGALGVGKSVEQGLSSGSRGLGGFSAGPTAPTSSSPMMGDAGGSSGYYAPTETAAMPVQTPKMEDTSPVMRQLLYGTAQGPYGPLLAYDIGERNG